MQDIQVIWWARMHKECMQMPDPVWDNQPIRTFKNNKKIPFEKQVIANSLVRSGVSTRKVGTMLGISQSAASTASRDLDLSPTFISNLKDSLPGRYYKLAHEALGEITKDKLMAMNGYQLILTSKISADAGRMCEGLPTQIIQTKTLAIQLKGDLETLRKRKGEILSSLGGSIDDVHDAVVRGNGKRVRKVS